MGDGSGIEWTDATWNPTVGCTKVSPGCDHCYAEGEVARRRAAALSEKTSPRMLEAFPADFDVVSVRPDRFLLLPFTWREPRRVFVNSLSDLFHADVPDETIAAVFSVMAVAQRHSFQLLTKRHGRMRSLLSSPRWAELLIATGRWPSDVDPEQPLPNVWLGVSAEDQQWADTRIRALLATPAAVRWVSAEPLLGPVDLRHYLTCQRCGGQHVFGDCSHLDGRALLAQRTGNSRTPAPIGLDWIVVGGESGPNARPMHPSWVRAISEQCEQAGVPFIYKQWGNWIPVQSEPLRGDVWLFDDGSTRPWLGLADEPRAHPAVLMRNVGKKAAGRLLDGRTYDGYPA